MIGPARAGERICGLKAARNRTVNPRACGESYHREVSTQQDCSLPGTTQTKYKEASPKPKGVKKGRVGPTMGRIAKQYTSTILKAEDNEKQLVYGVVLEPDTEDAQGDVISAEEIEKAAHLFLVKSRTVGDMHQSEADAQVVESYIAPTDLVLGELGVKKGSWIMAVHVRNADLWEAVKAGRYTGFSVGGYGRRKPLEGVA